MSVLNLSWIPSPMRNHLTALDSRFYHNTTKILLFTGCRKKKVIFVPMDSKVIEVCNWETVEDLTRKGKMASKVIRGIYENHGGLGPSTTAS